MHAALPLISLEHLVQRLVELLVVLEAVRLDAFVRERRVQLERLR